MHNILPRGLLIHFYKYYMHIPTLLPVDQKMNVVNQQRKPTVSRTSFKEVQPNMRFRRLQMQKC